VAQLDSALDF